MPKYAVEFIGTLILVLAAIGGGAIAAGFALVAMVYAGGHISGGHYNPAVSMAVWVRGRLGAAVLAPYWGAQLAAAVVGGLVASWIWDLETIGAFDAQVAAKAFVLELLFTFALAWVVLNVATSGDHPGNHFYGLAIGATVVAGGTAIGPITGGALNPAVGLGVTIAGAMSWANIWIYLIACTVGGALAGFAFRALQPDDV